MEAKWRNWVVVLLVLTVAVLSYGVALLNQNIDQTKAVGNKAATVGNTNNRFLVNFSAELRCLIVPDEALYEKLGRGGYFDYCDALLYRGTGIQPQSVSSTTTTTSPNP